MSSLGIRYKYSSVTKKIPPRKIVIFRLHPEINSGLLDPHSCYYILRKDRCTSVGGGVAAFVNRRLVVSEVQVDEEFADVELLCFDIVVYAESKLRFFVVY